MQRTTRTLLSAAQLLFITALAACGGGGNGSSSGADNPSPTSPAPTYSIGGTVSGLGSGDSVVLQENGGDNVTVNTNGAFTFTTKIPSGDPQAVTVLTQPTGQNCIVTGASGTMPANNVDSVAVSCTTNLWTWMSGSNTGGAPGVYGALGVGSTTNVPGARDAAISWTDSAGNFWLFGGEGFDSTGTGGLLNDLWTYTPSSQQWTWVSGANTVNAPGVFGTLGVGSTGNAPAARAAAASWTDNAGNLWLFGGDSDDNGFPLNDLWKYMPSTQQWTWMGGGNVYGTFGALGVASTTNVPGGRYRAVAWTDNAGNFWLFGGQGYGSNNFGLLNDLWKYTPSTQQWTWVSGPNTADPEGDALGTYGALGVASMTNLPGGRAGASSWTDNAGNLWMFGGTLLYGKGQLNDLWKYTPSTHQWTWVSGSNTINTPGVFGTLGVGSTANLPPPREAAISWTDNAGNLWLFGGYFINSGQDFGMINDLWEYTPSTQQWTWMSGANTANAPGMYGTLGLGSTDNAPAARENAISWIDGDGHLWLFGGAGPFGLLNDLWRY